MSLYENFMNVIQQAIKGAIEDRNIFEEVMSETVNKYIEKIALKYDNVDPTVLIELWEDTNNSGPTVTKPTVTKPTVTKPTVTKPNKNSVKHSCPYVFSRGVKAGQECNEKVTKGIYCSKHKVHEGKEPKIKKIIPRVSTNKPKKDTTGSVVLRKNHDINRLWEPGTKMVFESATSREVIGKCINGKIVSLTNEDIELCSEKKFKIHTVTPAQKITSVSKPKKSISSVSKELLEKNLIKDDIELVLKELQITDDDIYEATTEEDDELEDDELEDDELEDDELE